MFKKKNIIKYIIFNSFFFFILSSHAFSFPIRSIYDLLSGHPEINYIKCHNEEPYEYQPTVFTEFLPFAPYKGLMSETFVLSIPNGQVVSFEGWVKLQNNIIEESLIPLGTIYGHQQRINSSKRFFKPCKKITGKVAVISTILDTVYGHWLLNILTRLALLEMYHIEYDWLYVACDKPYMKETLTLWGINPAKIIPPFGDYEYIQADELIVPCHAGVRKPESWQYVAPHIPFERYDEKLVFAYDYPGFEKTPQLIPVDIPLENLFYRQYPSCNLLFFRNDILQTIRNKFISLLEESHHTKFSKKVFISRQDTQSRICQNEDELFELFKQKGFEKYCLAKMSYLDQVALFNNADIIVGAQGSGLLNILYCKKDVTVIEILQGHLCVDVYYLSQSLGLKNYIPIKTKDFKLIDHQNYPINIDVIKKIIDSYNLF